MGTWFSNADTPIDNAKTIIHIHGIEIIGLRVKVLILNLIFNCSIISAWIR